MENSSKTIYFDIKTPCKRTIQVTVCLGNISLLLQNASNSNVQSITSTSKKCHLLVQTFQNKMRTHDSCMHWQQIYGVLIYISTQCFCNQLSPNQSIISTFELSPQVGLKSWVPNEAKNEIRQPFSSSPASARQ